MQTFTAQILPDTDLFDGERRIPLSDRDFRRTVVASLKEWVDTVQPNILKEHARDGSTYGRVLDLYEGPGGIYVDGIITDADAAHDMSQGRFRFVSPTIAWGFEADNGKVYPAALLEVSLVSVPRSYTRQPDIQVQEGVSYMSEELPQADTYYLGETARIAAALSNVLDKWK